LSFQKTLFGSKPREKSEFGGPLAEIFQKSIKGPPDLCGEVLEFSFLRIVRIDELMSEALLI